MASAPPVETQFRHQKTELGWHDWRLTRWEPIERWDELVRSAYTRVSVEALERVSQEQTQSLVEGGDTGSCLGTGRSPRWRGGSRGIDVLRDIQSQVEPVGAVGGARKPVAPGASRRPESRRASLSSTRSTSVGAKTRLWASWRGPDALATTITQLARALGLERAAQVIVVADGQHW